MSRVHFTSHSRESELHGSERAYLGGLVRDLALAVLKPDWRRDELERLLREPEQWAHLGKRWPDVAQWVNQFSTRWAVGENWLTFEGRDLSPFEISLNTATLIGSLQLKAAAWIHGQCEVHGYVEEKDREWLADIFEEGVESGVYRRGLRTIPQGWEGVIEHLRCGDGGPVVMGYSTTDGFPSRHAITDADHQSLGPDAQELFYELPREEQWAIGLRWIYSDEARLGPFSPDNLDRTYGCSVTAFDLFDDDRLREKLGLVDIHPA